MRALALASLLLVAGCDVLDPMMVQEKQKPYRESDLVPTGLSMLAPPPGAVSRERVLGPALATGRNPDGTPLARIPVPVTRELLEQGRKRFDITCATCHGLVGDGRSLVARNMSLRPPPSLLELASRPDGHFFQVISQGFGLMPSYASEIGVEERWAVVAYLRALQLSQRARLDLAPAEIRSRLEREGR